MTRDANHPFEYEIALSFASEERYTAEELSNRLAGRGIRVLLDEYNEADSGMGGTDTISHLVNLYARKARYCVLLISKHYPLSAWTQTERDSARERALRDPDEHILPLQCEDVDVPGIPEVAGYRDLRKHSLDAIVDFLEEKIRQARDESGPPPESHDLRSGNIPPSS
jgi:hypothetical protein